MSTALFSWGEMGRNGSPGQLRQRTGAEYPRFHRQSRYNTLASDEGLDLASIAHRVTVVEEQVARDRIVPCEEPRQASAR